MYVDWLSWDTLISETGYDPSHLDRQTGVFVSGHPDTQVPDDPRFIRIVAPGTIGGGGIVDLDRYERGLLRAVADPELRRAAMEAWRRSSLTAVWDDMPLPGGPIAALI